MPLQVRSCLPDILKKPCVMTHCYTQDWHMQDYVRKQVVVRRMLSSVITMNGQTDGNQTQISHVRFTDARQHSISFYR